MGSGNHGEQTGKIMIELEKVLINIKPSLVAVFGDVNSTIATALVTSKLYIPLAHIEAGLRSFDRTMPEEINRVLTDAVADYLFTPSVDADENLKKEGVGEDKIFLVGNIMIDSLVEYLEIARERKYYKRFGVEKKKYWLLTLHRPSNVDIRDKFSDLLTAIDFIRKHRPVIFSVHPRAKKMINELKLTEDFPWLSGGDNFIPIIPVGYIDFLSLEYYAEAVLTDSGGMQEETTYLNIPCLTLRENTERPITINLGTNTLCRIGEEIVREAENIFNGKCKKGKMPQLWDGHTSERIIDILLEKQ
ncbi:UDP-2,3-diacetamido-2,3-dideoxy-D-glucuronate 2-epimerase [subsurface metagenome]